MTERKGWIMERDDIQQPNLSMNPRIERDRALLLDARTRGGAATFGAFVRLSGPGWLQSAITLGGGSLSSSMYLGVLVGFSFLWLQPLAMIAGIVMLSAVSYVTLSTGERPLRAINQYVNPVLGWGWLAASMMANLVWAMPQYSLAIASFQQNLLPQVFGPPMMSPFGGKVAAGLVVLAINFTFLGLYTLGGRGVKVFEIVVKCMVGAVVLCFIGVVVVLTVSGQVRWREYASGFIPDLSLLSEPSRKISPFVNAVAADFRGYWSGMIVSQQRDVMISAAATAVGINMTFMFPYSMLRKGWDRDFRGLAIFDLSTGLFFPFILATSCVVIAAAAQFHATPAPGFLGETGAGGQAVQPAPNLVAGFDALLDGRLKHEIGAEAYARLTSEDKAVKIAALPAADRRMAAMLVRRDAFNLSGALVPLTGSTIARYVFGLGVLGMGLGAATMLMLINSLCFCELLNRPARGWVQIAGGAMVTVSMIGVLFWKDAQMWLAVPTSVFCMTLLPLAYFSFFLLMNQKRLLGDNLPRGGWRVLWNVLMGVSASLAAFGSVWSIWSKAGFYGLVGLGIFTGLVVATHFIRKRRPAETAG
jgi:Mn2+/Fe2+ NRAMP family transporter